MRNFKLTLILGLVMVLIVPLVFVLLVEAEEVKAEYNWKYSSTGMPGSPDMVYAERFAELVEERSNGRMKIEVFPFGTLGDNRETLELNQMGDIELGSTGTSWLGGFVPEVQVYCLQYIFPKENALKVIVDVIKNGRSVPLLNKSFEKRNLKLLNIWSRGWTYFVARYPFISLEDFQGKKHRVMGSPLLVQAYNHYGFSTVTLGYGELYGGMQTRLIDSFSNTIGSIYAMSFFEVADYMFNAFNEPILMVTIVNIDKFNSLPKDLQDILIGVAIDLIEPMSDLVNQEEKALIDKIREIKPSISIYELSNEEIEPLKERALQEEGAISTYLEICGEDAKEILDALQADIKAAIDKFK